MKYFIFIFFLILLSSCGGGTVSENACSPTNLAGTCEKETDVCYKGVCIDKDAECERDNIMAPCENKATHYCKKNSDDVYECLPYLCSFSRPTGYCANEQTCVGGECIDVCSESKPDGKCLSGGVVSTTHTCIDGQCYLKTDQCSETKPDGICPNGFVCYLNSCQPECSPTNLEGACSTGKSCVEGYCLNTTNLCNEHNSNGECPEGKTCFENKCQYSCSETHQEGYCTDSTKMCRDGRCQYKCTQNRPNGVCEDITNKCINGDCIPPCSLDEVNGYCDEGMLCISGTCEYLCSSSHLDGYCDEGTACVDGTCQFPCSGTHMDGYCDGEYRICKGGVCVDGCSPENLTGPCERSDFYCDPDSGTCVEYPCGTMNLDGPCSIADQRCISGVCKARCSASVPTGYCTIPGFVCYLGDCVDPVSAPCSAQFPTGYCEQEHYECVSGTCLEEACSVSYPTGRCPDGKNCENGTCVAPQICSDGRPLDGVHGACCQTTADCGNSEIINKYCVLDDNEGAYCMDFPFSYENAYCINDVQCSDPYSTYGTEQEYYCNKIMTSITGATYTMSSCLRVSSNCNQNLANLRNKNVGESCNINECGNAECRYGLTCQNGICLPSCDIKDGGATIKNLNNNTCPDYNSVHLACIDSMVYIGDYENSGRVYSYTTTTNCANLCNSNNDCVLPNTDCKELITLSELGKYGTICSSKKTEGRNLNQFCTSNNDCKSQLCNVIDNKCTAFCDSDDDCQENGLNGFCHYNVSAQDDSLFSGQTQYLGICRYLDSTSTLQAECNHKSDCAALGSNYYCLPKFNENSVSGECGILDRARSYRGVGLPCDNSTFYCETDICISNTCLEYCTATSQCGTNSICVYLDNKRSVATLNGEYPLGYGVCVPKIGSMTECTNSLFPCSNNETCRFNKTKMISSASEVEYICMAKELQGSIIGAACSQHSDCQTGICNPEKRVCTTACQTDTQCEDVFANSYCKPDGVALVESLNPANNVYAGICDTY